jgi:hypothetical protein
MALGGQNLTAQQLGQLLLLKQAYAQTGSAPSQGYGDDTEAAAAMASAPSPTPQQRAMTINPQAQPLSAVQPGWAASTPIPGGGAAWANGQPPQPQPNPFFNIAGGS